MDYLKTVSVPLITAIVVCVMSLLKTALKKTKNYETFKQFIPLVSAVTGALLGLIVFFGTPQLIAAPNVLVAMLSGAASGLAATGCHQVCKQIGCVKKPCDKTDENGNKIPCDDEECKDEECKVPDDDSKDKTDVEKAAKEIIDSLADSIKNSSE